MMEEKHPFSERVLRDMNDAVLVLDRKGGVVYVNAPASRFLEVPEGVARRTRDFSGNGRR